MLETVRHYAGDGFFLSFCLTAIAHSQALLGDFAAAKSACDELDAIGEAMGPASSTSPPKLVAGLRSAAGNGLRR
jgi:hypothetical protein